MTTPTDRLRVIGGRAVTVRAGDCAYCAAPPVDPVDHCARCGRHIGIRRMRCLMDAAAPTVWCMRCRTGDGSVGWWDNHKPVVSFCSRAAARLIAKRSADNTKEHAP